MNKRKEQKLQTRKQILKTAKQIFSESGFLNTATSQISTNTGIAHGTLFLHFPNKESLIIEVLDIELSLISGEIQKLLKKSYDFEQLLSEYLELIIRQENLFSVLAKELPFYTDELRRKILFRESVIRSNFRKALLNDIEEGIVKFCDVNAVVTSVFGTIHYYLSLKNIFVKEGSVISKFKDSILSVCQLLKSEKEG
jgi:AcrR family transcriptional regulator